MLKFDSPERVLRWHHFRIKAPDSIPCARHAHHAQVSLAQPFGHPLADAQLGIELVHTARRDRLKSNASEFGAAGQRMAKHKPESPVILFAGASRYLIRISGAALIAFDKPGKSAKPRL